MNQFWKNGGPLLASALLFVSGPLTEDAGAMEDYRITNDVVLTGVRVLPGRTGRQARITFVLDNRSVDRISFGGIRVADARQSRIVASLGGLATTTLNAVPVASGDVLSADGKALWIEVDGLAKDLPLGGTIEATVHFGPAIIPITLTVDPGSEPSS